MCFFYNDAKEGNLTDVGSDGQQIHAVDFVFTRFIESGFPGSVRIDVVAVIDRFDQPGS